MKLIINSFVLFFITVIIFTGCKTNNPVQPQNTDNSSYFPNGNGTYYLYSLNVTDSLTDIRSVGTKSTSFNGTAILNNTTYQQQVDSIFTEGVAASTNISYFRKDASGIYYFFDTTGLYQLIPSQYLQVLSISSELRLLSTPLSDGLTWQVYKLGVALLNYNFIDIEATYLGKENITLNLTSGNVSVSAAKIKYVFALQYPNPNSPLISVKNTLTAYGWFVADIGPVQWQGNSAVLNGFSGGGINLGDTTNNVSQSLINYNIK